MIVVYIISFFIFIVYIKENIGALNNNFKFYGALNNIKYVFH